MSGVVAGFRQRIFRALHAEAKKRDIDHDALHDIFVQNFHVKSMSDATDAQLVGLYRQWTGKTLRRRAKLAGAGWKGEPDAMVSGEEMVELGQEFAKRGLGADGQQNFVRRQLKGRAQIRTRRDFIRVIHALRAMNERDGVR